MMYVFNYDEASRHSISSEWINLLVLMVADVIVVTLTFGVKGLLVWQLDILVFRLERILAPLKLSRASLLVPMYQRKPRVLLNILNF